MYPLVLAIALAGLVSVTAFSLPQRWSAGDGQATACAKSFVARCEAYASALSLTGEDALPSTTQVAAFLPPGHLDLVDCQVLDQEGKVYVHASVDSVGAGPLAYALRKEAGSVLQAGLKEDGKLDDKLVLPATIPDKAMVCVLTRP